MTRDGRGGFTLVEVLVALAIAGLVAAGLHRLLLQHRRFYSHVEATALNHDVLRVAWAVLTADLREADPGAGDVALLAPDSLRVRSPVAFGIACATHPATDRVALLEARGSWGPGADSVLVHGTSGWRATRVVAREPPGPPLACPYGSGTEAVLELAGGTADIRPGDPLRAFRSRVYHVTAQDGARWLARSDQGGTEILAGPLSASGGLRFRLLDAAGAATADPAGAERVELVVRAESLLSPGAPRRSSLSVAVKARNP